MKKTLLIALLIAMILIPAASFAQQYSQPIGPNDIGAPQGNVPSSGRITDVNVLATKLVNIGNLFIYLLITVAVIFIVWHVVIYLIRPGADDRKEAGKSIFYGILGLFIILSIWGLVNILLNTFGTNNNVPVDRIPSADFIRR